MSDATPTKPLKYASFNLRVIAAALDLGCVTIATSPLVQALMQRLYPTFTPVPLVRALMQAPNNLPAMLLVFIKFVQENPIFWHRWLTMCLAQAICVAAYTLPFWFTSSATPGKMLFAMEIRDATTFKRITRKQAILRFFGYFVAAIPLTLGFACAAFNKKYRGLPDYIANTAVLIRPPKDSA